MMMMMTNRASSTPALAAKAVLSSTGTRTRAGIVPCLKAESLLISTPPLSEEGLAGSERRTPPTNLLNTSLQCKMDKAQLAD